MSNQNPYAPPVADVTPVTEPGDFTLHDPVSRPISNGWTWIADGFNLFKQDWGNWLIICVVGFIIMMVIGVLPFANLINFFLTYVWIGGLLLGCKALYDHQKISVGHLFAGFKSPHVLPLVLLSVVLSLLYFVVIAAAFGSVAVSMMGMGDPDVFLNQFALNPAGFLLPFLIALCLFIPIMMAGWFAPMLIVFHKVPVFQALKMSFLGCIRNVLPFLIYGLVMLVLLIIGSIPLMLGLLIVVPVIYCSMFSSYKDIFVD